MHAQSPLATCLVLLMCSAAWPQGLPPVPVPPENPMTPAKAVLGKILFWDEQMSSDHTVACGTCHRPGSGGGDPRAARHPGRDQTRNTADDVLGSFGMVRTDAGDAFAPDPLFGHAPQVTNRSAPSFIGAAYAPEVLWDGRASGTFVDPQTQRVSIAAGGALESQTVLPPVSDVEMAHETRTWGQIVAVLQNARPLAMATALPADVRAALAASRTYPDLFRAAFGDPAINAERIAFAIATYERTLVPDQTPFDRGQLTAAQAAGMRLFFGSDSCVGCHTAPHFSDFQFHSNGLRPPIEDLGRQNVSQSSADRGTFKVPALRNVGLKPRFMHNGAMTTLEQVVQFYDRGGDVADNRDPRIAPLNLTAVQQAELTDFLRNGLTDPRVAAETWPFDRPALWIEANDFGANLYGRESAGSGGLTPQMLAHVPGLIPHPGFKVGVFGGLGGSFAILGITGDPANLQAGGIPINIDILRMAPVLFAAPLLGSGPGAGYATIALPLPPDPSLPGADVFAQWFVVDPAAADLIAATRGARLLWF